MGPSISLLFVQLMDEVMKVPDPGNGFFYMDHPFFAGLCGFKYNLWLAVKTTGLEVGYKMMLNNFRQEKDQEGGEEKKRFFTLETTSGGAFVPTRLIRMRDHEKLKELVKEMEIPEDWIQLIDRNPELLYRMSKNSDEVILKFAKKANSPSGVSSSLSGGFLYFKNHSAVYVAHKHVISESSLWHLREGQKKTSLLNAAVKTSKTAIENEARLTDQEILFYSLISLIISSFLINVLQVSQRFKAMTQQKYSRK
jgi:hypothetical protein